jgi:uncharacterized protein (TIRG00374 family)
MNDDAQRARRRGLLVRLLVVGLAALLLYLAFRGVDWAELGTLLAGARAELVVLGWGLMTGATAVRALRWRLLVTVRARPSFATMFWATMAGYVGNSYLPARAGDVMRSMLLGRHLGIAKTFVFGTTVTERVLDTIVVVALAGGVLSVIPEAPPWLSSASAGLSIGAVVALVALLAAPRLSGWVERRAAWLPLRASWRAGLVAVWHEFFTGSQAIENHVNAAAFAALSVVVWAIDTTCMFTLAGALGLAAMTPLLALLLVVSLALSSVAPSTPGYVGVFQFVAVSVLAPFDFVLLFQAVIYAAITPWGLIGLWLLGGLGAPGNAR